jgi:hypothetical protein
MVKKFGMVASATEIASKGNADFARVVTEVNAKANLNVVALGSVAQAHAGLSTQAMSLQHAMRSSIEMMAMGISPTQILASQINHLSYVATGPGGLSGAFKELIGLIGGPQNALVVGGLAAAGAAGYYIYTILDHSGSVEDHLKAQKDIADKIKGAFSGAKTEAARFFEESKAGLEALARINVTTDISGTSNCSR